MSMVCGWLSLKRLQILCMWDTKYFKTFELVGVCSLLGWRIIETVITSRAYGFTPSFLWDVADFVFCCVLLCFYVLFCFCFVYVLWLVSSISSVSLDYPFLIAFCNVYLSEPLSQTYITINHLGCFLINN